MFKIRVTITRTAVNSLCTHRHKPAYTLSSIFQWRMMTLILTIFNFLKMTGKVWLLTYTLYLHWYFGVSNRKTRNLEFCLNFSKWHFIWAFKVLYEKNNGCNGATYFTLYRRKNYSKPHLIASLIVI